LQPHSDVGRDDTCNGRSNCSESGP
jgi:hypothetical protein